MLQSQLKRHLRRETRAKFFLDGDTEDGAAVKKEKKGKGEKGLLPAPRSNRKEMGKPRRPLKGKRTDRRLAF